MTIIHMVFITTQIDQFLSKTNSNWRVIFMSKLTITSRMSKIIIVIAN